MCKMLSDSHILRVDQYVRRDRVSRLAVRTGINDVPLVRLLLHRIDIKLDGVPKESSKRLQYSSLQILVVFLIEHLQQIIDPQRDTDHFLGVAPEIGSESVV